MTRITVCCARKTGSFRAVFVMTVSGGSGPQRGLPGGHQRPPGRAGTRAVAAGRPGRRRAGNDEYRTGGPGAAAMHGWCQPGRPRWLRAEMVVLHARWRSAGSSIAVRMSRPERRRRLRRV